MEIRRRIDAETIIRAWKDETFAAGLAPDVQSALPANPAGAIHLDQVGLKGDPTSRYTNGCNTLSSDCSTTSSSCGTTSSDCGTTSSNCSTTSSICSTTSSNCGTTGSDCSTYSSNCSTTGGECTVTQSCRHTGRA